MGGPNAEDDFDLNMKIITEGNTKVYYEFYKRLLSAFADRIKYYTNTQAKIGSLSNT